MLIKSKNLLPCPLLDRTNALLKARSRNLTLDLISQDTQIPLHWLESFSRGLSKSPTVRNVVCLYEYLSGRQINLQ